MNSQLSLLTASHRMLACLAVLCTCAVAPTAQAEVTTPVLTINEDAGTSAITTQALRGNISVLMGSGGNIAVLNSPNGKLLVDAGIAVSRPRLEPAIAALGPAPIKWLINTHYHWDHTDGNPWLHELGATIVAHENSLKRLSMATRVIEWGYTFPALPAGGLPTVVFKADKTMKFEGETLVLKHYGAGHTDTDVSVYFKNADVLHVGDLWWNGFYPFIDSGGGGTIDGVIHWLTECLKVATARTIIIPGHGPVGDRAQLVAYRDMLVAIRNNVSKLKKEGKTLAETIAAKPTAAYDAQYGNFLINAAFFTQLVYLDV